MTSPLPTDDVQHAGERFLQSLARQCPRFDGVFVVVTHLMPSSIPFLAVVSTIAPIACIIPKPRSVRDSSIRWATERRIPLLRSTREKLEDGGYTANALRKHLASECFIILDIGGYLASSAAYLSEHYSGRLKGVIEDTENGHQRYQRVALPVPCISVARSECKRTEDYLVGESIVFSAEAILRSSGKLLRGRNVLVMGYGKIGQSIALDLSRRGIRVAVCDSDPTRLVLAASHGYAVVHPTDKRSAFAIAECIFCATGNHSIIGEEWSYVKDGTFVFAATSADDEFEMSGLSDYSSTQLVEHVTTLRNSTHHLHLALDGNAVNFAHGAEVRPFIHVVQGAMIEGIASLVRNDPLRRGVQALPAESERRVAGHFMAELYGHSIPHDRQAFSVGSHPPVKIEFRLRARSIAVVGS